MSDIDIEKVESGTSKSTDKEGSTPETFMKQEDMCYVDIETEKSWASKSAGKKLDLELRRACYHTENKEYKYDPIIWEAVVDDAIEALDGYILSQWIDEWNMHVEECSHEIEREWGKAPRIYESFDDSDDFRAALKVKDSPERYHFNTEYRNLFPLEMKYKPFHAQDEMTEDPINWYLEAEEYENDLSSLNKESESDLKALLKHYNNDFWDKPLVEANYEYSKTYEDYVAEIKKCMYSDQYAHYRDWRFEVLKHKYQ